MTQQYVIGELSLLLWRLQSAVNTETSAAIAALRYRGETGSRPALTDVAQSALKVADRACWDSLALGEVENFTRQSTISTELWEYGICAGLMEDR
jgi:hypothetical protein